ncbi:hypothetical protein DL93DRAFT_2228540 [Clavulina sp. PMI_390]|nr:hypothetical protein DL93DRAFT_2228540 [Clavulina sp. PMI_390]
MSSQTIPSTSHYDRSVHHMEPLSSSDRNELISLCQAHDVAVRKSRNLSRTVIFKDYFVKYNCESSLHYEFETLIYLYDKALEDPSAPRIPKPIDYFDHLIGNWRCAYIVMEHIQGAQPAKSAPQQVAEALQWLHSVPAPPGVVIGTVGGGPARHKVFKDYEAPLIFANPSAIAAYLNKALTILPRSSPGPSPVDFSNEPIIFSQSDMHPGNFIIDQNGELWLIDFESITLLPESFAKYTVLSSVMGKEIPEQLGWSWDAMPNGKSMSRARTMLWMTQRLALDEYGNPTKIEMERIPLQPRYSDRIPVIVPTASPSDPNQVVLRVNPAM